MRKRGVLPADYTYNLLLRACRDCGTGDAEFTNELMRTVKVVSRLNPPKTDQSLSTLDAQNISFGVDDRVMDSFNNMFKHNFD